MSGDTAATTSPPTSTTSPGSSTASASSMSASAPTWTASAPARSSRATIAGPLSRRLSSIAVTARRRSRRCSGAIAGACSRRWAGASALRLGLVAKPFDRYRRAFAHEARVGTLEGRHDLGHGNIGARASLAHVFHVPPAARVVGMEEGVGKPVELERANAEALAERAVEGRGRLDPSSSEREFRIAVVVEDVATNQPTQPRRAEVVTHVPEAETGRDARRACPRGQEGRLGHAEARPARQACACPVGLGRAEIRVRRVGDVVTDRVVEMDGALGLVQPGATKLAPPGDHPRVVAVHECRGGEIRARFVRWRHALEYIPSKEDTQCPRARGDGTLPVPIWRRVSSMEAFAAPVHAPDFKSGVRL